MLTRDQKAQLAFILGSITVGTCVAGVLYMLFGAS